MEKVFLVAPASRRSPKGRGIKSAYWRRTITGKD